MSNSERVVLALGGAGTVGSGVVKALLDKGKLDLEKQRKTLSPARRTYSIQGIFSLFSLKKMGISLTYTFIWRLSKEFYAQMTVSLFSRRGHFNPINCRVDIV